MAGEEDAREVQTPAGGSRVRGLLLHKLMEEVLTGELREQADGFRARARKLLAQLDLESTAASPDVDEIGATAWRTLQLPEIAALRPRLVAELPVYAWLKPGPQGPDRCGSNRKRQAAGDRGLELRRGARAQGYRRAHRAVAGLSTGDRDTPRRTRLHDDGVSSGST
jgi:hypothetical protein